MFYLLCLFCLFCLFLCCGRVLTQFRNVSETHNRMRSCRIPASSPPVRRHRSVVTQTSPTRDCEGRGHVHGPITPSPNLAQARTCSELFLSGQAAGIPVQLRAKRTLRRGAHGGIEKREKKKKKRRNTAPSEADAAAGAHGGIEKRTKKKKEKRENSGVHVTCGRIFWRNGKLCRRSRDCMT